MTGFGADGSRLEKELDFEQVRGDFENNPFVTAVLKHIEVKTALGDELIGRMQKYNEDEAEGWQIHSFYMIKIEKAGLKY